MKIQGSYTPPMGQSVYSNLKQNISTPARQNGPEHTAQTMQKLAKPDQAKLDAHQLINDMRIQAYLKNHNDIIQSVRIHLVKAYQGFEAFKEQQMTLNPDLDLRDLDVALKDGNIIMTGIKSQNGGPVTGNQITAIQEALSNNEELTKNLKYSLSDLTKAVNIAKYPAEFEIDINELASLEYNKENIMKDGFFSLNGFIEGFLDENPRRPTLEEVRDTRKRDLFGYPTMDRPKKDWDFGQVIEDRNFGSLISHYISYTANSDQEENKNYLNTKA